VAYDEGGAPPGGWDRPGDAGPPPPDRRPWIIAALLAVIIVVLILILLLQGDDDGDDASTGDSSSTSTSLTTTSSSTTVASSTTASTAPSTTVAPVVTVPPDECADEGANPAQPGPAAVAVFEAWVRGDEACAEPLMTGDALAELFSRDGEGAEDEFQGCTEVADPEPHADCAFTYEGGSTHYLMNYSPTDGWVVFDVTQVAD
jgi:hypothetical protein